MTKAELVGGQWCGIEIVISTPTPWLWIEGSPERLNRPRVYHEPGAARMLYRHVAEEVYDYAGYLYTDCPGCGLVHARRDQRGRLLTECSLCGASLSRATV